MYDVCMKNKYCILATRIILPVSLYLIILVASSIVMQEQFGWVSLAWWIPVMLVTFCGSICIGLRRYKAKEVGK